MNFIHGANGSGKSAILAGIQFVFGARANDIGRGSAARSLIREDQSECEVEIWLANKGTNAFHDTVYGDTIKIRRTVKLSGAGKFYAWRKSTPVLHSPHCIALHCTALHCTHCTALPEAHSIPVARDPLVWSGSDFFVCDV